MISARVWAAAIGGLCFFALPAASTVAPGGSGGARTVVVQGQDEYALTVRGTGEPDVKRWGERASFIVQFRALPRALAARQGANPLAARAESDLFSIDFARLAARARGGTSPTIRRRFETCFSGAAIAAGPEIVAAIRELPYVVGVFPDDSVHVLLDVSVPQIGAPDVWARYGATGQGIIVAILDTGIDYDHPALGGGFGPAYRVVAGHDFANDDDDPRDDVGHGTHVAGIVGANGGALRGVAPDAHFHAYKVLGPEGGLQSDVVAGVERAVDPDQNPLTDDAVDVMNLSLGGPGDADNPLAQAVDAATQAGVVVAVAGGNQGDWYSIGSPAAARQAITVGAVDDFGQWAGFSSRGPALGSFALKPDLMAPGVGITSTSPGGGTATYQGTSMAAPHVAGAAALIRQIHPDWSPAQVKASLMNTAVDLGLSAFTQGTGRISVPAAVDAPFLVTPPSLSLGRLAQRTGVTVLRETLQVTSTRTVQQQIQLSLRTPLPGLVVTAPPTVTVPPLGTVPVAVEFTVDAAHLPAGARPWTIDGAILASAGATTCAIPYGLAVVNRVAFAASDPEQVSIILHDRGGNTSLARAATTGLEVYVGPGDYDMMAIYARSPAGDPWAFVVRDVDVARDTTIALARTDAPYEVTWAAVEHDGRPLVPNLGMVAFLHETDVGYGLLGPVDRIALSAAGPDYRLDWGVQSHDPGRSIHLVSATRRGPFAAEVLSNQPEDFQHARIELDVPPDANAVMNLLLGNTGWHGTWWGLARLVPTAPGRLTEDLYMVPWARPDPPIVGVGKFIQAIRGPDHDETVGIIPALAVPKRGEFRAYHFRDEVLRLRANELDYRSGMAPLVLVGALSSSPDSVFLHPSLPTPYGRRLLMSRLGDFHRDEDATYRLFRDGVLVQEDTLRGSGHVSPPATGYSFHAPPGDYVLEVNTPEYVVGGVRGHAVAAYAFVVPPSIGISPPTITGLQFLSGDAPTDSVAFTAAAAALRVNLSGRVVDSVRVEIAAQPNQAWQPVATTVEHEPNSSAFVAMTPLPSTLRGLCSVRIRVSSGFGDLTYTMIPAFVAGGTAAVVVEALEPDVTTQRVVLQWKVLNASVTTLPVYRREPGMDWKLVGHVTVETDRATFEDSGVRPGRRYDYALQLSQLFVGETSVTIPVTPFALFGARPVPTTGEVLVEFALPSDERAQLELFDVTGRLRRRLEVGDLGPGVHVVPLGRSLTLRSGVYWIRLRQSGLVLSARTAVVL